MEAINLGPNRIEKLLEKTSDKGRLTYDQILTAYPEAENSLGELEELFALLQARGVELEQNGQKEDTERTVDENNGGQSDRHDLSSVPTDDILSLYLAEMSRVPLLTREQEVDLARQLERGRAARRCLANNGHDPEERARLEQLIDQGEQARDHMIEANTRLVVSVAKKYRGYGMPFSDLIQAGNLGLIKAVDKYDHRRGVKLGTYATWWIRQSITRTLAEQGRTIRIPVHMNDLVRKLYNTSHRLEQGLGRRPTPEEIAEDMELPPDKVRWMMRISRRPLSLEKPVDDEEETELGSFIEDEDAPSPADTVDQQLLRENLEEMLSGLSSREVQVLRLRFGLQDGRTHTLNEVGSKFGVTRERIRQIELGALRKLRHPRHARKLRSHLS